MSEWGGLEGLLDLRARLHGWARAEKRILAAAAFGSTERTDRPADAWSDLDFMFVVEDAKPWLDDLTWVDPIGSSWLRFVHESPIPRIQVVQVLFAGGYDADLIPVDREMLEVLRMPEVASEVFGHGARLVVDRVGAFDAFLGAAGAFPVASESAIRPPAATEFAQTVSTYLYQTVWATKRLRRGERWRAHDDVDDYMRDRLLRMIEWHALSRGADQVHPGSRGLERWVPDDVAAELPATFARYDDATIAEAIVRGHVLFRRLAREVAERWRLGYPDAEDAAIEAWVRERLQESGMFPAEQG